MTILVVALGSLPTSPTLRAQGCEPIRFTTPIELGGQGQAYQTDRGWRLTVGYRNLVSDDWFVGTQQSPTQAPLGVVPIFKVHSFVADVAYTFSNRFRTHVSVPFSTGSLTRKWADGQMHEQSAAGIGDINVRGDVWLWDPKSHENFNLSLGLGVDLPTGSNDRPSQFYTASGAVPFPADQTIQPADGGWGLTLQAQSFLRMADAWFLYGNGYYLASPTPQTAVTQTPTSTVHWSVPDVYDARLGVAFSALPSQGLSLSLGGRVSGIPQRDLFGGGDATTVKRTSFIFYIDPGLGMTRGKSTITLSVPIRTYVNRTPSQLEAATGGINGGGFAKYLVVLSYAYQL